MTIVPHQNSPVLRRIGVFVNLVGNELAYHRLLGEPLPRGTGDGVPSDVDGAGRITDAGCPRRDHVRLAAETERVLELELALKKTIFPRRSGAGDALLPVLRKQKENV